MKRYKESSGELGQEIKLIGIKKYIDAFDEKRKIIRKIIKKKLIIFSGLLLVFIGGVVVTNITNNPVFICVGLSTFIGGSGTLKIIDYKEEKKLINKKYSIAFSNEMDNDFLMDYSKKQSKEFTNSDSYYTDSYKKFKEENIRFYTDKTSNISLVDNSFYNKEESILNIVKVIDSYYEIYKLPPFKLTNKQWDTLVDMIYEYVEKEEYYNTLLQLVKFTFADILINGSNKIILKDFIRNLCYIDYLKKDQKLSLQNRLGKVVDETIVPFKDSEIKEDKRK